MTAAPVEEGGLLACPFCGRMPITWLRQGRVPMASCVNNHGYIELTQAAWNTRARARAQSGEG